MTSTGTVRLLPRVRIVWLFPKAEQFPKRNLISKAVRVKCFLEKWMTFDKATLLLLKSNVNARKHTRARNRKQTLLLMSSSGTKVRRKGEREEKQRGAAPPPDER
ncbi:uncharacterized [Tachysurus ichikawai]